ncbi:MAG: aldehyde dehydrogenase (nadp) family protein [Acidobacteria bacterium]|jgi:acyl-CoA reductase-like NAD-dependent aldehyde dehydrogenase|nr:aldehyde dehydrogenase (nadp) family protein [Acidobacteriota bacterium]
MKAKKILINGEWLETGESFAVKSPFTQKEIGRVSTASRAVMDEVIAAAETASIEMRKAPRYAIAEGLRRIAAGIEKRKEEFARTIAEEAAKPLKLARGEVERGIAVFAWAAGEAERFSGEVVPVDTIALGKGKNAYTKHIPRGVIYGITPFNFPLNLVGHKVAPALASGNSIIIKPSQRTPLTALLLGEVFAESGLPKAALQVVPMDVANMDLIYADERVKMISFTGSADVGWDLKQKAGKKVVSLELGGNAPVIIDETADLERSLERTTMGAFSYSGQICISVQRVYVHEKIYDEWTENFVRRAANLKTGDPLEEATELSVMIDEAAAAKAGKWIEEAVQNDAELLCGGKPSGAMLPATVLTGTNAEMRVVSEEIFAPVAVVEKFRDFEEAVDRSNHSKYGLQAGVFTNDFKNANFAQENLEYGGVIINDVPAFRVDNMPYGGVKNSGFGREGVRYAMEEMSEIRLIVINF